MCIIFNQYLPVFHYIVDNKWKYNACSIKLGTTMMRLRRKISLFFINKYAVYDF